MELFTAALTGLAVAAGGTLFPGMLNMTAVSTALRAGRRAGFRFAAGMASTFMVQAGIAIFFAEWLTRHPQVITGMKQWAIVIFITLAGFFLWKALRARAAEVPADERPYYGSPYVRGIGMALMNFLTLPYCFALGGWLISDGYLDTTLWAKFGFTWGAGAGAMVIFGTYARMAEWIRANAAYFTRNINFILSGLFVVLTLVQGGRLLLG